MAETRLRSRFASGMYDAADLDSLFGYFTMEGRCSDVIEDILLEFPKLFDILELKLDVYGILDGSVKDLPVEVSKLVEKYRSRFRGKS